MCNYIMKNGNYCPKAPTKTRCSYHPLDRYKDHETCPIKAKESMKTALYASLDSRVQCPCGTSTGRQNLSKHCKLPKHQTWMRFISPDDPDNQEFRTRKLREYSEEAREAIQNMWK